MRKRLLPLLLTPLLLLSLVLLVTACKTEDAPQDTTAPDEQSSTPVESTQGDDETTTADTAPSDHLNIVLDGKTEYRIICADEASEAIYATSITLKQAIDKTYKTSIGIQSDYERNFDPEKLHPYEILIGETNRPASTESLNTILYNDTLIEVRGTRLVITGGNEQATIDAVQYFISTYLKGEDLSLPITLRDYTAAEYPHKSATLDGVPLSEYTIIYSGSAMKNVASEMAYRIGVGCGARIKISNQKTTVSEREIVIGKTNRDYQTTAKLGYDDFVVEQSGKSLYINGGSDFALNTACARLSKIMLGEKVDLTLEDLSIAYTIPDRAEYVNDIEKLYLHWEIDFQTPEWMLDFDEKYAAFEDPDGRLMSCFHRGDMVYYPENSIEGIISAIRLGGDMVEIDPRLTKDGVFILLHDETLTRTTNYAEKAGKNGLPDSPYVSDWTYEELMQLNLKIGSGGANAAITPYKIPTLDEAFKVCANRIFVRLDVKGDSNGNVFWDMDDVRALQSKYNCPTTFFFTWHARFRSNNYKIVTDYRKEAIEMCGKPTHIIIQQSNTAAQTINVIRQYGFTPAVRLGWSFSSKSYKQYLEEEAAKLAAFKGKVRLYSDCHGGKGESEESYEFYETLYNAGVNYQLVNNGFLLCKYISENFTATPYTK